MANMPSIQHEAFTLNVAQKLHLEWNRITKNNNNRDRAKHTYIQIHV